MKEKELVEQEKQEKKKKKDPEEINIFHELFQLLVYFVIVCVAVFFVNKYVTQRNVVDGDSMYPTLHDKDCVMIDKLSYRFHEPERFDIIVFPYNEEERIFYIKRIIALPGETVQIINGEIYVNDIVLEEDYGYEAIADYTMGTAKTPITLGEDEYFVLGDNRNNSIDSRDEDVGLIKREEIRGKACFRIFPLKRIGTIK